MKKIYLISLPLLFFLSCKKGVIPNPPVASLALVNVVVGGVTVRFGNTASFTSNNSFSQLAIQENNDGLYVWPRLDSLHPYYTQSKFVIEDRAVYSLYLTGTPSAVEGILIKEEIPFYSDSVCGIRFVNLSPNSNGLNITLSTSPAVNQVTNLQYKQFTDFKLFPGKASNTSYVFQIRKASDNTILSTYSLTLMPRFANITLVIRGLVNAVPALGVTRVNNDR